jgi:hypothetical protein
VIKRVIASRESGLRYAFADYCETIVFRSAPSVRHAMSGMALGSRKSALPFPNVHDYIFLQVNRHEL